MTRDETVRRTQNKAHRQVGEAIKKGILVRPSSCSKCGNPSRPNKNGVSNIQGHHEDYSKPLEVVWLCAPCHRAITPLPEEIGGHKSFGERNGQAKLTYEQVAEIRASSMGCVRLGRLYGIDKKVILGIKKGTQWTSASPLSQGGQE